MVRFSLTTASFVVLVASAQLKAPIVARAASTELVARPATVSVVSRLTRPRAAASAQYIYVSKELNSAPPHIGSILYFTVGSVGNATPAGANAQPLSEIVRQNTGLVFPTFVYVR